MEKHLHPVRSNQTSSSQTAKDDAAKKARPLLLRVFAITLVMLFFTVSAFSQNCSVNAGVPETICPGEQLFLYGNRQGVFPATGCQLRWSQVGGPTVTIVDPGELVTEVINLIPGNTYKFRICSTCEDGSRVFQDVEKTVLYVTPADAGTDATYCPGTYSLNANFPVEVNEIGFWQGSGNNGITITTVNLPTSDVVLAPTSSGLQL